MVATARNPQKAQGLTSLAAKYGDALTLVPLDVLDPATIKVRICLSSTYSTKQIKMPMYRIAWYCNLLLILTLL